MRSHGRSMNRLFVCARNTIRPKLEEIVRRVLHETHGRCVAMTLEGGIILELVQRGTEPAVRPRAIFSRSHSDQFPIWDHIGRVDGSVSVAFKTVDVDRVAGIVCGLWKPKNR